jgi:hypothetical protein
MAARKVASCFLVRELENSSTGTAIASVADSLNETDLPSTSIFETLDSSTMPPSRYLW